MSLKSILDRVQEGLKRREEIRDEVQRDMRRATRLSKQAILFVHQERFEEARKSLEEAESLFVKLRGISEEHPNMVYIGLVEAAFEEYAEAQVFLRLVEKKEFTSPEEFKIPEVSYVLGLGDVIGEFRRRALDSLRRGDIEGAEECLRTMEQIYIDLTAMDDAYLLVPGLRRKCDIARRVIETTRGDVTMEARRSSLEHSIQRLEKALKGRRRRKIGEAKSQENLGAG
ncbi:MAG: haloacid dehalogenase [Candidatus Bathyarchaeia archaeon]